MGYGPSGCGIYCRVLFPGTYDQLILAFKAMKNSGVSEGQAVEYAQNGAKLAGALYTAEFGLIAGLAAAFI